MDARIVFLKEKLIPLLRAIPSNTQPVWGKMTVQQMIEHLTDTFRVASGRLANTTLTTPPEKLEAFRQFLMSNQPFPKGIENPLLPKDPVPVRNTTIEEALNEPQTEIDYFFTVFEENNQQTTLHPYFGQLDFNMNVQAQYKHMLHHLKQFGVEA